MVGALACTFQAYIIQGARLPPSSGDLARALDADNVTNEEKSSVSSLEHCWDFAVMMSLCSFTDCLDYCSKTHSDSLNLLADFYLGLWQSLSGY